MSVNLSEENIEIKPVSELLEQDIVGEENIKEVSIILRLGDIIVIKSETNEILNNHTFIIEYIDPTKIKLVNVDSFEKIQLRINANGVIGDGSITEIKIISSNPNRGYARQNDLLTGTWVNIYFSGDIPLVITGQITDLEEDMIEIKTTDNETIYINFQYYGIPEDLPIEVFEIRPPPEQKVPEKTIGQEFGQDFGQDFGQEFGQDFGQDFGQTDILKEVPIEVLKEPIIKRTTKPVFFDASQIEFGDIMHVQEYVNMDRDKYRFNLETQTNDLLEEMISTIPTAKRTTSVMNSIHIMITRFIQLRNISSTFDHNKNITGIITKTANDKPLADYLSEFKNSLYWIMMVAKNVKKTYVLDEQSIIEKYRDIEVIPEANNLLEMSTLFKRYKSNEGVEGQNKYSALYNSLNKYTCPFLSENPEILSNVFNSKNGIIVEGNVQSNMNVIIDNLGDLSSTIVSNGDQKVRKFVVQKYNLGLDKLYVEDDRFKGSNMNSTRVSLTPNDDIAITSIITMPEPVVQFSQINLPGSNLLVKSNLNLHFLNYWQFLKQKTNVTPIEIDDLNYELDYNNDNFVDNIKNYMLNLSDYEMPISTQISNQNIYKTFLNIIVPKIIVLFNLVKKYINGKLSMTNLISYLEPFLIYSDDLTYMNYKELDKFILIKIREYNSKYVEYSRAFSSIKSLKTSTNNAVYIFDMVSDYNMKLSVFNSYGYNTPLSGNNVSKSELLKNMIITDYGNLFNNAVTFSNLSLMYPVELNPLFEEDKDKMKAQLEQLRQQDGCTSYVIAKKYYTMERLLQDNGGSNPIFFDKEYDTTNYDIINEDFKKERETLTPDELEIYITEQLKRKYKKNDRDAMYLAETLVNQAKKVIDGQYAIISVEPKISENLAELEYYVRKDNVWVLASEIDPKWFIKEPDILCNINPGCIYNTKQNDGEACETTELSKETIVNNALSEVMKEFDKNYNISKSELTNVINKQITYHQNIITKLINIHKHDLYKYNNQKYNIGLSLSEESLNKIISPYYKLSNLIVGQSDFVKKQFDIVLFADKYCRQGDPKMPNIVDNEMENIWWFYCKETNAKLIPAFRVILARTFVKKPAKYDQNMESLIKIIGQLGDNGAAWVDIHSGEVIRLIDFEVSDGFKDGFKDVSRSILEKDIAETTIENYHKRVTRKDLKLSPEGQIVSNIISSITSNMGVNLDNNGVYDFIIKVVTELMNDIKVIEKEGAYKEREKDAAKKGKKLPEYVFIYSSTLLYLTLGMILIGIQTSIPSIKTRKTFPGCVRSFTGYPFEGEGNTSGLDYLACVAFKQKNAHTIPWNALSKVNLEKMTSTIKVFINKFLLPYSEVDQKIKDKVEYLLVNPENPDIHSEHSLSYWTNFLPPLRTFHIKNLDNVSDGFQEELINDIRSGNPNQINKLFVIQSKISQFSLAIQEEIQKIVFDKDLLLKSSLQPFMTNSCCNENELNALTSLQYFIKDNPNINTYNQIVRELTALLRHSQKLVESAIMNSSVDTKRIFPDISNEFSEETIYKAFISLCYFHSAIPLTEDLLTMCTDKPTYLSKIDTIQEKIAKLKRDDRHYNKEKFLRLFQIVCRNNLINISLSYVIPSCSQPLQKVLLKMEDADDPVVAKVLRQKMEKLLETYDLSIQEDTDDMRQLKNYLAKNNDVMRKDLLSFIKRKSKLSGPEFKKITTFMNELTIWNNDVNRRNDHLKISDDSMYNYINFYKNFISLFSVVFPTMILNKKINSFDPHRYWKFAQSHNADLKNDIEEYFKPLEKFYGNISIDNISIEIQNKCKGIILLSQTTPAISNTQIGDQFVYNVFDKITSTLLFEYYILQIFNEYINLTTDPEMVTKLLKTPNKDNTDLDLYDSDFLVEQQLKFSESEELYVEGNVGKLQENVAKLLSTYISIMMNSKKIIDISYDKVEDIIFKLKESEKYTFTDRLKDMDDEQRAADSILKMYKLGVWSVGLTKGIKKYDPENYEHEKEVSKRIAELQNKVRKNNNAADITDMDIDDALEEQEDQEFMDADELQMGDIDEDFFDGDPYGDERED